MEEIRFVTTQPAADAHKNKPAAVLHTHTHVLDDGTVIEHCHSQSENDNCDHSHELTNGHQDHEHESQHGHSHDHEHPHDHCHAQEQDHSHDHNHTHGHSHKETKAVLNRMSRIIGHMQSVQRMIEHGRDCTEILTQLSAISSALQGVSRLVLKDHISSCMVEAVESHDDEAIEELLKILDRVQL